jgi:XTP/dITP diphosphohydrolase
LIRLYCATGNSGKLREFQIAAGLAPVAIELAPGFRELPPAVEDGATFEENALRKALHYSRHVSGLLFADDSGLEVDALDGAPGVHSARFAAMDSAKSGNTPDADNNARLLRLLKDIPAEKRTARFHCVIALVAIAGGASLPASRLVSSIGAPIFFNGVCEGLIILTPRGENGFGYDPLFVPVGFEQTFAELGDEVKNKISHRSKALEKLKEYFGNKNR